MNDPVVDRFELEIAKRSDLCLESVVQLIRFPVFIVDRDLRVAWQNLAASHLLDKGEFLSIAHGRLRAMDIQQTLLLRDAFEQVLASGRQPSVDTVALSLTSRTPGRFCETVCCPLESASEQRDRPHEFGVLFVSDPTQHTMVPVAVLKSQFNLTDCECRLALALLAGMKVDEYCRKVDVSLNTARTHLKSIFRKTETSSQARLVVLLSTLVPPVEHDK